MTQTGKVYVAPLGPIDWEKKGWKELGYTTEDEVLSIDPAEPPVITMGRVHELKVPDLSGLSAGFKSITVAFQGVNEAVLGIMAGLRPGYLFLAPGHRRPEHLRRMRASYRHKRGRRRFR